MKQHEIKYGVRKIFVTYLRILYEEGQRANRNFNHNRRRLDRNKTGYVQHGDHVAIECVVQKYRDLCNTELSTAVRTASLVAMYQFMSSALRRAVAR